MTENLPNFLIVGTAKAATTTIHEYLKQHPDIFMTEWKEPCFFKFKDKENINFKFNKRMVRFVTKLEDYKALFKEGRLKKIRGESSTPYLYFYEETIENIKRVIPNHNELKILIVLRNPVDRAFSQYMMKVRDLEEEMTFKEAINNEGIRMNQNAHFDFFYVDRGMYYKQVKAYLQEFKNVKVVFYEDFTNNPISTLDGIVSFLDLEKINFEIIKNLNVSGKPRIKFFSKILIGDHAFKKVIQKIIPKERRKKISQLIMEKNLERIEIDEASHKLLREYYLEDIKNLELLLGRNLNSWYK